MSSEKFTDEEISALKELGWGFYQIWPSGWQWLKFDHSGSIVGRGGDETWAADIASL